MLNNLGPLLLAPGETLTDCRVICPASRLQMLFCIKEAVVKAASRAANRFLELRDIMVHLESHVFHARVKGMSAHIRGLHGLIDDHAFALATRSHSVQPQSFRSAADLDACSTWAARRKHEPPELA